MDYARFCEVMTEEALAAAAKMLAEDRTPNAEEILAEASLKFGRLNHRKSFAELGDLPEADLRERWRPIVGRRIRALCADLRPS